MGCLPIPTLAFRGKTHYTGGVMNDESRGNRWPWVVAAVGTLGVLALLLAAGVWASHWFSPPPATRLLNTATVLRQVQTMNDWVTVKYVLEKVVIVEDAKWYGENRVLLVAHGVVKAGVDLRQLKAESVRFTDKTITLELPPAHVTDVYLDERRTEIIERSNGLLRKFDKDLEQNARRLAVADIRSAAIGSGIINEAGLRAKEQLIAFFRQLGFENVEIKSAKP